MIGINQETHADLKLSPKFVAAIFVTLAVLLLMVYIPQSDPILEIGILFLVLLLFLGAAGIALLESSFGLGSRVFAATAALLAVNLGLIWLRQPQFVVFVTVPVLLTAGLLNFGAAALAVLAQTAILWGLWALDVPPLEGVTAALATAAVWATWAVQWAIYHPVGQLIDSFEQYRRRASHLLDQANERKLVLEQTLADLARANRDLSLLNERLDAMRLLAEEAQKTKTAFVAKISHEFRTPLNMIIGLIDTLTETPEVYGRRLPPELLQDLEIVHRNSRHLASMINDVLDLSQTEAGHLALHREWVDLADDLHTALAVVQPLLQKKKLELRLEIAADLPPVYCDKTRIRQVILNLVSNAARYTETGHITVAASHREQYLHINVSDTGPGISPEDIDKIFEPFCQGTNSLWRDHGGTGLGLSISKQFIEQHHGQIWVNSQPNVGSTFSFKLPVSPAGPPESAPHRWVNEDWVFLERTSWPKVPAASLRQRIILWDETGHLAAQLSRQFEQIEFIDTIDLAQTLQELRLGPAHAVIFNAVSPDALRPLLEEARHHIPDIPVIGCAIPSRADQFLEAGAVDYLIKPVVQDDLKEALQALDAPVRRILLADDNPDFRQLLTRMLHILDDSLEVVTAANGRAALELLLAQPPDLLLLDVVMPEMDGWEVLARLQTEERCRHVPVIMITAEDLLQQPSHSDVLLATTAQGISAQQLVAWTLQVSRQLLTPAPAPDPAPQ